MWGLLNVVRHQSHDHPIQIEEEHQQVEPQFDERLFLMFRQGSEDLGGIQQVVLFEELVDVVRQQRSVDQEWEPESVHQEQKSHDSVQRSLRNEPRVQFVAQLDGIDVVTLQVRVHDGEEHLGKQVDCV